MNIIELAKQSCPYLPPNLNDAVPRLFLTGEDDAGAPSVVSIRSARKHSR